MALSSSKVQSTASLSQLKHRTSMKGAFHVGQALHRIRQISVTGSTTESSYKYEKPVLENTYQLEATQRFPVHRVREIIHDVLDNLLSSDVQVEEVLRSNLITRNITNVIKDRVKMLDVPRYKIVVNVLVGQSSFSSLNYSSRCLWNDKLDNFVECNYSCGETSAVVTVYGIYVE